MKKFNKNLRHSVVKNIKESRRQKKNKTILLHFNFKLRLYILSFFLAFVSTFNLNTDDLLADSCLYSYWFEPSTVLIAVFVPWGQHEQWEANIQTHIFHVMKIVFGTYHFLRLIAIYFFLDIWVWKQYTVSIHDILCTPYCISNHMRFFLYILPL